MLWIKGPAYIKVTAATQRAAAITAAYCEERSAGCAAGTLFVLQKDASPKERLLEAVQNKADDDQVQQLVEQLQESSPEGRPASSAKTLGKWKLLWSMQVTSMCGAWADVIYAVHVLVLALLC